MAEAADAAALLPSRIALEARRSRWWLRHPMQSAGFPDDIVSQRRRPSGWVVVARMRALVPLVEPVPSLAMVAPVFLPPGRGVFWVELLVLQYNESCD